MLMPERKTFGSLLTDRDPTFEVPDYQRPYSWEKIHVDALFQDLRAAAAESKHSKEPQEYFLGTMVLVHENHSGPPRFDVVDGQQRLTTLLILMCVIRDVLHELGDKESASKIHDRWIAKTSLVKEDEPRLILKTGTGNDDYFQSQIIQRRDKRNVPPKRARGRPPKHHLKDAYSCIETSVQSWLETLPSDTRTRTIAEFATFVADCTFIITLTVGDVIHAHTIFETLNTRGLDLSIQDLVRNLIRHHGNRAANSAWDDAEARLAELEAGGGFKTFIRTSWSSRRGRVSFKDLYASIRDELRKAKNSAISVAQDFQADAPHFSELVRPQGLDREASSLRMLEAIGLRQHLPCLLSASRHEDPSVLTQALALIEAVTVRYLFVQRGNPNRLEDFYVDLAMSITKTQDPKSEIRTAATSATRVLLGGSTDADFKAEFADLACERPEQARYLLSKLELHKNTELQVSPPSELEVEHILPKSYKTSAEWRQFADPSDFVNRLGNLTLLGKALNKSASNKGFRAKRDEFYKDSNIKITKALQAIPSWTPQAVSARQMAFAELAPNIWSLTL